MEVIQATGLITQYFAIVAGFCLCLYVLSLIYAKVDDEYSLCVLQSVAIALRAQYTCTGDRYTFSGPRVRHGIIKPLYCSLP